MRARWQLKRRWFLWWPGQWRNSNRGGLWRSTITFTLQNPFTVKITQVNHPVSIFMSIWNIGMSFLSLVFPHWSTKNLPLSKQHNCYFLRPADRSRQVCRCPNNTTGKLWKPSTNTSNRVFSGKVFKTSVLDIERGVGGHTGVDDWGISMISQS